MDNVKVGTEWQHDSGRIYKVLMLTDEQTECSEDNPLEVLLVANEQTTRPAQYPVTVVYKRTNGLIGSMTKDDWYSKSCTRTGPVMVVYQGQNDLTWIRPLSDWHRSMTKVKKESKMQIEMIVAAATNNVIGNGNQLPWSLPGDLKYFKETTTGHPIIMGRKTYESIGRPLPNRTNIVLTAAKDYAAEGCVVVSSIPQAVEEAHRACYDHGVDKTFIIGGAALYNAFMSRADKINLTQICSPVEGDTYFPAIDEEQWERQVASPTVKENGLLYYFTSYIRRVK